MTPRHEVLPVASSEPASIQANLPELSRSGVSTVMRGQKVANAPNLTRRTLDSIDITVKCKL
jgi:hypothetical protein